MAFEYEALVGHLYVVSGRAIHTPPPGALVEVAPRKSARGREADTLFLLVMPSGDDAAPSSFYEQMAEYAADKFFNTGGSTTASLRTMFSTLNENLYEHNNTEKHRYEATMIAAVMRGSELIVARVGSGVALFKQQNIVQQFPVDFTNDEELFGIPLGVNPVADIKFGNYQISNGIRLLLADGSLADFELPMLVSALSAPDIASVLNGVKSYVPIRMSLMGIEFVPAEVVAPIPVRTGESSREIMAAVPPKPVPPPPTSDDPTAAPVATPPPPPPAEAPRAAPRGLPLPIRKASAAVAKSVATVTDGIKKIFDRLFPQPDVNNKTWLSTPLAAGAAVLIPVVVVGLVIGMWVTGTGESEFDECVERAQEASLIAQGIISSDVGGTINAWNAAVTVASECRKLRPDIPDETLDGIILNGQSIVDRLLEITRRDLSVIAALPQAGLTRAVLQASDLYVLDDRNDQVYRITLTPDGLNMVANSRQVLTYMRRGVQLNEYQVDDIIDITWAEDGSGLSQGNVLVALDRTGLIIDCSPRFTDTCQAQRLLSVENWNTPISITVWNGRLYVLDPGANQVWRYDPAGGAYPNAPLEYFSGEDRPDIRTAVDFAIDPEGQVFILLANGNIIKFNGGVRQDFGYANFPQGQQLTSATAFYLNTSPIQPAIYIASQTNRTVFETTQAGTFDNGFRPTDETLFASLADVVMNNDARVIYALSGNSVFAFPRDVAPPP
jgi:hypothetical protein